MVARSELVAARSEAKAKAGEAEALEAQLARLKEQLRDAQASLGEMVARTELTAATRKLTEALAKLEAADEAARTMGDRHRDAMRQVQEALGLKEEEACCLRAKIQVCPDSGLPVLCAGERACALMAGHGACGRDAAAEVRGCCRASADSEIIESS